MNVWLFERRTGDLLAEYDQNRPLISDEQSTVYWWQELGNNKKADKPRISEFAARFGLL